MSVLYGIGNINSAAGMAELLGILGGTGFTSVNAYALMVFCLLYTPCIATIATIKRETQSWRWTLGMVMFQLVPGRRHFLYSRSEAACSDQKIENYNCCHAGRRSIIVGLAANVLYSSYTKIKGVKRGNK